MFRIMVLYLRRSKLKCDDYETNIDNFGRPLYYYICQQG